MQKDAKTLTVEVKSPGEGEYNLAVLAKGSKDKAFKPVCHYMLTNKITKQKSKSCLNTYINLFSQLFLFKTLSLFLVLFLVSVFLLTIHSDCTTC